MSGRVSGVPAPQEDSATVMPAFGGPMNEQLVLVHGSAPVVYEPYRLPVDDLLKPSAYDTAFKPITYAVETFGYHDPSKCPEPPFDHDDRCRWMARALVADGYPRHRITDTLNAIVGMTRLCSL